MYKSAYELIVQQKKAVNTHGSFTNTHCIPNVINHAERQTHGANLRAEYISAVMLLMPLLQNRML